MELWGFAVVVGEALTSTVGVAAGAGVVLWSGAVESLVDRAAGIVCDAGVLISVEVAALEWSTVWAICLGHAASDVAAVFDDCSGASWADRSNYVAVSKFRLAGWASLINRDTGVAVGVADKVAWAVTKVVADCGFDALTDSLVAVASFLAAFVTSARLWDTSVTVVTLEAHSADFVGAG